MPTDANGTYTLPPSYFVQNGDPIQPVQHNPPLEDLQQGMTDRLMRDGRAAMTGDLNMDDRRVTGLADGVDPGDGATVRQAVPTGAVISYLGETAPIGYLALSGGTFSRTTHARLYAWALTSGLMAATEGAKTDAQFGPGDGSTTFSLPNHNKGYFHRGWNGGAGLDPSRNRAAVQASQNLAHSHTEASAGAHTHGGTTDIQGNHTHAGSTDVQGVHSHTGSTSIDNHNHGAGLRLVAPNQAIYGAISSGGDGGRFGASANEGSNGTQPATSAYAHAHTLNVNAAGGHAHNVSTNAAGAHSHNLNVASAGAHTHVIANDGGSEARPHNIALLYCIKT